MELALWAGSRPSCAKLSRPRLSVRWERRQLLPRMSAVVSSGEGWWTSRGHVRSGTALDKRVADIAWSDSELGSQLMRDRRLPTELIAGGTTEPLGQGARVTP